jgi:predicted metalloprotease with PDZ domain
MRRLMIGAFALLVAVSGATAQERMTDQERKELEYKLQQLQQQMHELERQLGRQQERMMIVRPRVADGPMAIAIGEGRPRLGVVVKTETDAATDSIGAVLEAVTPDGPAAKAGLQAGDIVVTLEGQRLAGATGSPGERLIELARDLKEGDSVRVAYRRGKDAKTAVVLPRMLDSFAYEFQVQGDALRRLNEGMRVGMRMPMAVGEPFGEARGIYIGMGERWSDMELTTLDADLGGYFGTTEGLLVVRAPKDSLLGLKSGDVIVRIGGRVPTSPSHAMRIFRSYEPGDEIRVEVMRNKRATEVKAVVPQAEHGLHWEEKQ